MFVFKYFTEIIIELHPKRPLNFIFLRVVKEEGEVNIKGRKSFMVSIPVSLRLHKINFT